MISDYEEVVIRFKAYRISYPLTQKELSDKSGVSLRSITRFESGEDISLVNFMKLMNAMELMNNFVNVIPDMNNRPSSSPHLNPVSAFLFADALCLVLTFFK